MSKSKAQREAERVEAEEALTFLRDVFPPGSTVHTVLRHVSASGMTRRISVLAIGPDGDIHDWSGKVATAIGWKFDRDRGGVIVGGAGMDMGFHLVYTLSYALHGSGYDCLGDRCPSSDHSNRRDPVPSAHADGYALRHRWV